LSQLGSFDVPWFWRKQLQQNLKGENCLQGAEICEQELVDKLLERLKSASKVVISDFDQWWFWFRLG